LIDGESGQYSHNVFPKAAASLAFVSWGIGGQTIFPKALTRSRSCVVVSFVVLSKKVGRIEIRGFGSFTVREYGAYTGRNPKTGKKTEVGPKKLPFFKVGKELKEMVDG